MGELIFDRAAFDRRLMDAVERGDLRAAATDAIKAYGPEIYALLASIHSEPQDADDVFSLFCEKLWKGLAGFEGRSALRTWAYRVAWSASARYRSQKAARREVRITDTQLSALVRDVRSESLSRHGKERRSRLREIRQSLPIEDQLLLVLRVERELGWKELAQVMNPDGDLDEEELGRESARLRKRYQALKERLRALLREA